MVTVDIDHPDIEEYVNWKVVEEQKVAALVAGSKLTAKLTVWLLLIKNITRIRFERCQNWLTKTSGDLIRVGSKLTKTDRPPD